MAKAIHKIYCSIFYPHVLRFFFNSNFPEMCCLVHKRTNEMKASNQYLNKKFEIQKLSKKFSTKMST